MFYADSLGFFQPPIKNVDGRISLNPPIMDSEAGIQLIHVTSVPPFAPKMEQVLAGHDQFRFAVRKQNKIHEVLTPSLYLRRGVEVVYGLQNAPDDADVGKLYEVGIRIIGIAYRKPNRFGSGFSNLEGGLTEDGISFLCDCGVHRMAVDLSHASHQTARDVLVFMQNHQAPRCVLASHGGCYSVFPRKRNLPDDVLRGIAERGGVVGIATLTFALHEGRNDLGPLVAHLKHAVNVCGEDAVCIGSDGWYTAESEADGLARFEVMKREFDPDDDQQARYPDQPPELNTPKRMEVIERRLTREFNSAALEKVMSLNFLRFLERSL